MERKSMKQLIVLLALTSAMLTSYVTLANHLPPPPPPPTSLVRCPVCHGDRFVGRTWFGRNIVCDRCQGTGRVVMQIVPPPPPPPPRPVVVTPPPPPPPKPHITPHHDNHGHPQAHGKPAPKKAAPAPKKPAPKGKNAPKPPKR